MLCPSSPSLLFIVLTIASIQGSKSLTVTSTPSLDFEADFGTAGGPYAATLLTIVGIVQFWSSIGR